MYFKVLTKATDEEWDEVPCSRLHNLKGMSNCGQTKADCKDDCRRKRRVVLVVVVGHFVICAKARSFNLKMKVSKTFRGED